MNLGEWRIKNLKNWEDLLLSIFNGSVPENCVWEDQIDIVNILKVIGENPQVNHTFFPTGGGLDLEGAAASYEKDCIELIFSKKSASIIKPTSIIFQSFGKNYEWAYFRIETQKLEQSGVYENLTDQWEELTEIAPGEYADRAYWDEDSYGHDANGRSLPLPDSARVVSRFFSGAFVIFAKSSTYNAINATYDGRHSKMTSEEFKEYIDTLKKKNQEFEPE